MVETDVRAAVERRRRRRIGDLPQGQQRRAVGHEDRGIVGAIGGDSEAERIDEEIASLGDVADGEADMMGALCQGFGGHGIGHFGSFSARSAAISVRSWLSSADMGRLEAEITVAVMMGREAGWEEV